MQKRSRSGFSILELAIVVLIIGILAALAIPLFAMIMKNSRFSTLSNDLRTYAEAFQTYALEEGDFPPTHTTPGTFVPGMNAPGEQLLSTRWIERSPIGGVYTWERNIDPDPSNSSAFIQIIEQPPDNLFNVQLSDIAGLDEDIDDGNLATGYLQVAGNRVRYFLQLGSN